MTFSGVLFSAPCRQFSSTFLLRKFSNFTYSAIRSLHEKSKEQKLVLGIETSCDDTGAGVVDSDGNIRGEGFRSQLKLHLEYGGVIPTLAAQLHRDHIHEVVNTALKNSAAKLQDLSAIAVTVKPGMEISLAVGLKYAKQLAREAKKPLIPVHHMHAHALTIRLIEKVEFPFLVLLASGGHCQIAVVQGVDDFLVLGQTRDNAPGEVLDKVARQLKLKEIQDCSSVSGGKAIEILAQNGNPLAIEFQQPRIKERCCDFSFSGMYSEAMRRIKATETEHNIVDTIIPGVSDFCASFQYAMTRHMVKRVQRAMEFCEIKQLIPDNRRILVLSGGCACNNFIKALMQQICDHMGWAVTRPPKHLCNDNGIMIAWTGMEMLLAGTGIASNPEIVDVEARCPLGKDYREEVLKSDLKLERFKFDPLKCLVNN